MLYRDHGSSGEQRARGSAQVRLVCQTAAFRDGTVISRIDRSEPRLHSAAARCASGRPTHQKWIFVRGVLMRT